ncbi:hypothetical protein GCM10010430_50070 [Kitasatospora cystarginea]|uniref:Uncharacterized protein n=1 Tax=Kitasatospora cystarginea TaxID=58350 RepID=A0ABN3EIP5_9ACTN
MPDSRYTRMPRNTPADDDRRTRATAQAPPGKERPMSHAARYARRVSPNPPAPVIVGSLVTPISRRAWDSSAR